MRYYEESIIIGNYLFNEYEVNGDNIVVNIEIKKNKKLVEKIINKISKNKDIKITNIETSHFICKSAYLKSIINESDDFLMVDIYMNMINVKNKKEIRLFKIKTLNLENG